MSEGKAVDDARLPGAVGSEEQRKRAQWDALRRAERFEVREAKGGQHRKYPIWLFENWVLNVSAIT
jgi:hypothetical protein